MTSATAFDPLSRAQFYPRIGGNDATLLNPLWSAIVQAAQAQLMGQQGAWNPQLPPQGYSPFTGAPAFSTNRGMPSVVGGNNGMPFNAGFRPTTGWGNGGVDFASLLRNQLFAALPQKDMRAATGQGMGPLPMDSGSLVEPANPGVNVDSAGNPIPPPVDSAGNPIPPVSCQPPTTSCPPVDSSCPPVDSSTPSTDSPPGATGKKVFILGDLKKFGGGTVRNGLKELLRGQTEKDRKGERTHSKLSPEDTAKVRALLESNDPEVKKLLDMKVPNKKSLIISEDGKLLDTVDTKTITQNQSLGVGVHEQHMNDGHRNFDRSAGGQVTAANGQTYDVAGTELHSPIKIALDGKDAKLNSTNGFAIDLNGFNKAGGQTTTSGGLNGNEAWLVRDKEGNGIKKNGVVDGNDVYGDHNGQFKDGYNELARDFASEVKTDPKTGKRYIDLTDPNSRAGKELQLLDAQGNLRPAKDVLTRIDIDGTAANERDDKGNVITARSNVTYKDGHTASSADQWYTTGKV